MKKGTIFLLGNVIENTDEKIQNCIRYLGVAPESVFLKRHRITLDHHYGEKKNFYIDLAFLPLQNLALECIAPLDGDDNDYRHYLELNGTSGIHHVNLDSDLYEFGDAVEALGSKRIIWNENSSYVYFDTRELLGIKTECADLTKFTPDEIPQPKSWETQARVTTLGIVVRDIQKKFKMYGELLGVDLTKADLNMNITAQELYNGDPGEVHLNVAHIPMDNLTVELLEPLDTAGPLAEFLQKQGEGIYYVGIDREHNAYAEAMAEAGIQEVFSGSDRRYICYETSDLLGFRTVTVKQ